MLISVKVGREEKKLPVSIAAVDIQSCGFNQKHKIICKASQIRCKVPCHALKNMDRATQALKI